MDAYFSDMILDTLLYRKFLLEFTNHYVMPLLDNVLPLLMSISRFYQPGMEGKFSFCKYEHLKSLYFMVFVTPEPRFVQLY